MKSRVCNIAYNNHRILMFSTKALLNSANPLCIKIDIVAYSGLQGFGHTKTGAHIQ